MAISTSSTFADTDNRVPKHISYEIYTGSRTETRSTAVRDHKSQHNATHTLVTQAPKVTNPPSLRHSQSFAHVPGSVGLAARCPPPGPAPLRPVASGGSIVTPLRVAPPPVLRMWALFAFVTGSDNDSIIKRVRARQEEKEEKKSKKISMLDFFSTREKRATSFSLSQHGRIMSLQRFFVSYEHEAEGRTVQVKVLVSSKVPNRAGVGARQKITHHLFCWTCEQNTVHLRNRHVTPCPPMSATRSPLIRHSNTVHVYMYACSIRDVVLPFLPAVLDMPLPPRSASQQPKATSKKTITETHRSNAHSLKLPS